MIFSVNVPLKKYPDILVFLLSVILIFAVNNSVYGDDIRSTNQNLTLNDKGTFTYCLNDPVDLLIGMHPHNSNFSGPGIADPDPNDGQATFNPSLAGIGTWIIKYHGKEWTFIVTDNPVVTLAPFGTYCTYSPEFTLTGGLPADPGGKYYVNGILSSTFNPSLSGPGTHEVVYTINNPKYCLGTSNTQYIVVKSVPMVFNQPTTPLCSNDSPVDLSIFVSPAGGIFSGPGVIGNKFDPSMVTAPGTYKIRYTCTDSPCTYFAERNITVNLAPVADILGLAINHCDDDPDCNFSYSPVPGAGATGVLEGDGITDSGGGNATFSPSSAGIGYHIIKYTYTDINGCISSRNMMIRVGTDIKLTGLNSNYCANEAPVNFNYSHWDAVIPHTLTITSGTGLTDNGNGSATFNPSLAGPGSYTITYTFTSDLTCLDRVDQFIQVLPVPTAQFSGLNATLGYCNGAPDISLNGNPPGGTFTGPAGSITDHGGGTATFKPSALAPGGPYPVTYTYISSSGCNDTETKNVTINLLPADYMVTGSGSYCQGSGGLPVTLSDSDPGIDYQLFKNGVAEGAPLHGTGSSLTWPGKTGGTYTVTAANIATACTKAMNGTANLFELSKVTIISLPLNDTVCQNGTAVFSITASGQNLSYAWTKNGIPVGGNSNILTIDNAGMIDNGHNIVCTVSSTCGGPLVSTPAKLVVLPETAVTTHPAGAVKCANSSVSMTVTASGYGLSYIWKKGGVDMTDIPGKISGSTSATLVISNLDAGDKGSYTCHITGICGSAVSNAAVLDVIDPVVITTQPESVSSCAGSNTAFNTVVSGSGLLFHWYFDNGSGPVPLPGANSSSYPINNISPANAGIYYCKITSPCGESVNTSSATLSIPAATVISADPSGITICEGGNANLTVTASGSNLAYQWIKDGVELTDNTIIHGSNLASLSLTGVTTAYAGNYTCRVSGDCGILISTATSLIVEQTININIQPVNKTVCPGSDVTFSVRAGGTSLTYKWEKNNIPIPGADYQDFTITASGIADAGNYRCKISNGCGHIYSTVVTLTINPLTAILTQPLNVSTCEQLDVSFLVTASGSNLTYQWFKNAVTISGETNPVLNLLNVSGGDVASYYCVVSGTCGSITSSPASLEVDITPVIATHPLGNTVCPGTPIELSVIAATGTNLKYQWIKDGTNVGTDNPVYSIPSFAAADAGSYQCNISNKCGTVSSNSAVITVGTPVNITSNPVSVNSCTGSIAYYTVTATGSYLKYHWMKDGTPLMDGGKITGVKTSTLTINGIVPADNGNYSCRVTNSCNNQVSSSASLIVSEAAIITVQPQNETGCKGEPLNILVIASGTNLNYQWYKNGVPTGIDNPVYAITAFTPGDAGTYRCEITNGCGTVVSENAIISTGTTTNITTHPASAIRCIGNDINFLVVADGTVLSYQWKKNGVIISDDGRITGTKTSSLSITGVLKSDIGTYSCDVIGQCGTITSNGAFLSVKQPAVITSQPDNLTVCNGDDAVFDIIATGDDLIFSWQKNGIAIVPPESSSSLVINAANNSHEGIYNCLVSNVCSFEISTSANLIVDDNLVINDQPVSVTDCEGKNVAFSVNATGPASISYQWYKDGITVANSGKISGANSAILNINSIATADNGSYSCRLVSQCGNAESDIAVLSVSENVRIDVHPASFSVLNGNDASFTIVASGDITGYQWQKNGINLVDGSNISGSLTPNLVIKNTTSADEGAYTCIVTGTCNSIPGNPANLTVMTSSLITVQPVASVTICEGGTLNLFISTSGSGHTYQWKKDGININNTSNISGATTPSLMISNLNETDQGAYTCLVNAAENSSPSLVMINPSTVITQHPLDATRCVNDNAVFVTVAKGAGLNYQWQKNLVDIPGAQSGSYTINPLIDGDDGVYTCVVTGLCGSKTSNPANLVVNKNTLITSQPSGSVVCEGITKSFTIVADGDNLTYQWKKNGTSLSDGGNISGTTKNTLVIANALPEDAGGYSCTVSGACGSETSNFATLTVNPLTLITFQPLSRSKCEGDNVIFAINATGSDLIYQWKKNGLNISDDGIISGTSTSTLTISSLSLPDHPGTYTCLVTGSCGVVTSDPAVLTISNVTSITSQPLPVITICQNTSTNISVAANGGNLLFQWRKNGNIITDGGNISGTTTNNLVISNALISDAGFYNCMVTGTCGIVTSEIAALQVNPVTVITTHPAGQTLCEGDNVQFTVSAAGAGILTYQWKKDNIDIFGASGNSLSINSITTADAGAFSCTVTGLCGIANSNPANLVVNPGININVQPVNISVCEDNTAIISLNASGTDLIYKWKHNDIYISDDGRISGTNTGILKISSAAKTDEGLYKCEILSSCGSKFSNQSILTVDDSIAISLQPVNQTIVQGSTASFSVSASGIINGYQWQKDGVNLSDVGNISGSTESLLTISNVSGSDKGLYHCVITGKCGTVNSDAGVLTVDIPVSINLPPVSQTKCSGESVSFTVSTSGTVKSYQWKFNGTDLSDGGNITGSQTSDLIISAVNITNNGYYTCSVTGNSNIANSNAALLTVNSPVLITDQPDNRTICNGDMLALEVKVTGDGLTYQWEKDDVPLTADPLISGINSPLLTISGVTASAAGSYRCTISNSCGTEKSNPAVITINPGISISSQPLNDTKCEGETTTFSVITAGVKISYQWLKNGSPLQDTERITGSNSNNLIINNLIKDDQGSYNCIVSDDCSSLNSNAAVLTVKKPVAVTSHPSGRTVCEGEITFFEVIATGDNLNYQWQKDGINLSDVGYISGSQSSVLMIQNTIIADMGVYRCNITGDCNTVLTNPSTLSVTALPGAAGAVTGTGTVCQGVKNILYVVPEIPNAAAYEWALPYGASIRSGGGTRSIEVDFAEYALSGVITVRGINSCGSGTLSPVFPVTVNLIPAANAGSDQILCSNTTTLNANPTAFGTWTLAGGLATINDPNLSNSSVINVGMGRNTFVWTVIENGCVARDTLVISNKMVFVNAGEDQTVCSLTASLNANDPASGSGNWSIVGGGGTFNNINDPKTSISNLSRGTNVLRWSINNEGCISYDDVIIINDLPDFADAGKDTIILVDNYTLNANVPLTGTSSWSLLSGSAIITNPSLFNTTVTDLGIEENIFRWTITKNLCYTYDDVKVINYTPTITDAGPNKILCEDHTILQGTKPNYGTGQWSVIAGSGTFTDPHKYNTEVRNIGKGPNIYRWTVYEYKITYDEVTITNNSPSQANAGIDQKICSNKTNLAGNDPLIGTGAWTIIGGSGTIANPGNYNSGLSNLGPGSNTFRWTITNNGCSSFDEVVVTNDQPTAAMAGVDQITCADSVNLYPNTPTIGTGEWSVVQGSAFFVNNKAYNLSRGENLLKWTIYHNGCYISDTVKITSNKPTTSFTGEDKTICVDSITLPGNTPVYGTGVWTMLYGSATFEDITDPQSKVTNLATGQNRFRWTITYDGCLSYSEVDINYNYIQADAGPDQELCQTNALLSAGDPGIGSGQWSVVGGSGSANFINPTQATTEVINLDKGINILRWTVTNGTCVSYDDVTITNNIPGTAYAGSDRSVCGEEILLNANKPTIGTGEWTVLSGSANIADPALYKSRVSNLSIGQNVLRWTVTNKNCKSSDEVVIMNDQPSNIDAGPDQYLCSSSAQVYATVPAGGSGRWSISNGSATFQDNTLYNTKVNNLEKGENMLVWTVTISGCSNSDTVIIVNNLPTTPNAGPDQDLCANVAFMSANQPETGTGRWSIVSGSAAFQDRSVPGTQALNIGNGLNTLRWTITNEGCSLFDEVIITNSLPTLAYAGEDRAVCNTTANLLAAEPVSGTGSWSVVSGYGVFTDPKKFDTQITALGFGPNTLRWTTENGRCRTSDDVIVTNNLAEAYAGADQIVYASDAVLVGNKPLRGQGEWIIVAGRGTILNPTNFETNVADLGGGANTFSWTINNDGCIASDDVVITNKILPITDFNPQPSKGCAPLAVSFVNNSVGGAPFHWDFGDGGTSNATNTNHTYTIPGKYRVRLSSTGPDGIILHKDTIVTVYEIPVAQFKVTPELAYIPGNSVNFFNITENTDSCRWEFGDGSFSRELNPSHKYSNTGSYDVTLHVWSGFQCYDSLMLKSVVNVERAGIIKCPNAFTPNLNGPTGGNYNQNDFSNDVFHCYVEGAIEYHLEIYNRLGIILFRSDDISIGWDGYYKGKLVEEGSYVFNVYGTFNNGQRFDHFGNIVVLH